MSGATIVAAAVVIDGGRVLLTQRPSGTHLAGSWEFPGGKLEPDESPEQALARELHEELGVDADVGAIVDVTWWRYPTKTVLLLFYRATITGAVQHLGVADHAWVAASELDRYAFPPADERVLRAVRGLLGEGVQKT